MTIKHSYYNIIEPIMRIDYVGGENPIYIGKAEQGTLEAETKWQIMKLTYDLNDNVTDIDYANNTEEYSYSWASRATYDYTP